MLNTVLQLASCTPRYRSSSTSASPPSTSLHGPFAHRCTMQHPCPPHSPAPFEHHFSIMHRCPPHTARCLPCFLLIGMVSDARVYSSGLVAWHNGGADDVQLTSTRCTTGALRTVLAPGLCRQRQHGRACGCPAQHPCHHHQRSEPLHLRPYVRRHATQEVGSTRHPEAPWGPADRAPKHPGCVR